MQLLDKTPDSLLYSIGLNHVGLRHCYFMNNTFFNDVFSNGPTHIAEVTMSCVVDFMNIECIRKTLRNNGAIEHLKDSLATNPNVKRFWFINSGTKYDFLDNRLCFERITTIDKSAPLRFINRNGHRSLIDFIPQSDVFMACWLIAHNKRGDASPDYLAVKRFCITTMEDLMDHLVDNFHANLQTNSILGKYAKSEEVIIRQTAMAFWAAISIRNLLRSDDFQNIDATRIYHWDFGLHHPCRKFEELCNVVNGTSHNYVDSVFDENFRTKEYDGHLSVAKAIVNAL